jgi:hypothetical protein
MEYGNVEISGLSFGNVYHGSLYVGEAPLTLRLPVNRMDYIELLSTDNSRGTVVFQTPSEPDYYNSMLLPARIPSPKGSLEKARRMFYWSWGGTWITGIITWLTYQSYIGMSNGNTINQNLTGEYNQDFYNSSTRMFNISMGALATLGVAAVFDIIFMSRYIYIANKNSTPIFKTGRN